MDGREGVGFAGTTHEEEDLSSFRQGASGQGQAPCRLLVDEGGNEVGVVACDGVAAGKEAGGVPIATDAEQYQTGPYLVVGGAGSKEILVDGRRLLRGEVRRPRCGQDPMSSGRQSLAGHSEIGVGVVVGNPTLVSQPEIEALPVDLPPTERPVGRCGCAPAGQDEVRHGGEDVGDSVGGMFGHRLGVGEHVDHVPEPTTRIVRPMQTRIPPRHPLGPALDALAGDGLVVVAPGPELGSDWEATAHELGEVFEATRTAMTDGVGVVFVVHGDDLLGRRGAVAAMVATGLLSGARTAALEGAKAGIPVNVLAVSDDSDPEEVADWASRLLGSGSVSGEIVRLGTSHLGKALP